MSTHPHPKSEKRALDDDDSAKRKTDLAKEFKHTKAGVWDIYEQVTYSKFGFDAPFISKLSRNLELLDDLPFFWRALKDLAKIKSCWSYLCLYILVKILTSLQPAVALWYVTMHIIHICGLPDTLRSGLRVTTLPSFVFFAIPLTTS